MSSNAITPNHREILAAQSTITGKAEYLTSTNHVLNSSATISGSAIPISSATTAVAVGIVDGSGNQITSFGGGTQYTDAAAAPANPIGPTLIWNEGGTFRAVSTAKPLPVTASFSPSGTQDVNITKINGAAVAVGHGLAATALRVELPTDGTGVVGLIAGSAIVGKVGIDQTTPGTTNAVVSQITDGTNTANVLANDAGLNGQAVNYATKTIPFTTSVAGVQNLLANTDVRSYASVTVNLTSVGVGLAWTAQFSPNSGGTYSSSSTFINGGSLGAVGGIGVAANTSYVGRVINNYFQLAISALTSGTVSGFVTLSTAPLPYYGVGASQSGTWTVQPGNTPNSTPWLMTGSGTAGTPATGVLSIQGITSMTPILATVTATNLSTNIAQIAGTTASVNNGAVDAGTLRVTIANNSTGVLGTVSTVTTVSSVTALGTVTPGTAAANLGKAEDSVHASGDTGVFTLGVGNEAQTTLAADGDYIAVGVDTKGNHLTVGNLANDAVDAGAPVKIGAYAITALPTAVANADRVNMTADKFGRQVTIVGTVRDLVGSQTTTITSSTSETTVVTQAASVFNDLTSVIVSNTSGTATRIDFRDTTAGAVIFSLYIPAGDMRGVAFSRPLPQTTVNTNWTATCGTSVADVRVFMEFDKNR